METNEKVKIFEAATREMTKRGLLKEYYDRVDDKDKRGYLGSTEAWVYKNDRPNYTPHFHVRNKPSGTEFEKSLIEWSVIHIKCGNPSEVLNKKFFKWLDENVFYICTTWDENNKENTISDFVSKHPERKAHQMTVEYLKTLNNGNVK